MDTRYLYADLYALAMWAGMETPEDSGNYTSKSIPFACSKNTPIACDSVAGSSLPSLGYIYSFGEDNSKDIFLLTSKGVYRVVRPSLCNYTCPIEKEITTNGTPSPGSTSWAHKSDTAFGVLVMTLLASFLLLLNFGY